MTTPAPLFPPSRYLMGPGPSDAPPSVLRAMAAPLIGHLDPAFIDTMNDIKAMLQQILNTANEMTFAVSAPGSAGMEMCLVNLLEPGDEALVCVNGVFGNRMSDIVERCGAKLHRLDIPWGQPVTAEAVASALEGINPKIVCVVHAETSTGACSPINEISTVVHDAGALLVVDAVTSLGGIEIRVDDWQIDALYSGSQKCLSAPPGISPVTFSDAAMEVVKNRQTKVQSWFLDLNLVAGYVSGGAKRAYHHTAPVSAMFAFHEALRLALEEGLDARYARHAANHERLKAGLTELGISFLVDEPYRLPQLNAVWIPEGVDDAAVRTALLTEYNIEIGAGLGDFAGKAWRIGLMGGSSSPNHVDMLLAALTKLLP